MNHELLTKLPGLGIYTAAAILVFAFKQEVPLIDTNVRQIITHFFLTNQTQGPALREPKGRALEKEVEIIARQLIPKGKSWEWHQALMDFGALELSVPRNSGIHSAHIIRNSRLQSAPGPLQRKALPFRQSNRFYRGRIIDLLRVQEISETKLLQELIHQYQKPKAFLDPIIASLLSDGLIERVKPNILRLPEA